MTVLFPLIALSLIAVYGRRAVASEPKQPSRIVAVAGALGGFANGVVRTWLVVIAIRAAVLFVITKASFSALLVTPLIFAAELWVLFAFTGFELCSMGGQFSAATEWLLSQRDGKVKTIQFTIASSVLSILVWLFMIPGEYESYRPNMLSGWTAASARSVFPLDAHGATAENVVANGRIAAIPDAVLLATALTVMAFFLVGLVNGFRRQLKMYFLESEPRVAEPVPVGGRVPRGGELN